MNESFLVTHIEDGGNDYEVKKTEMSDWVTLFVIFIYKINIMKKTIRLTESDLIRLVKRVIKESKHNHFSEEELDKIEGRVRRYMNPGFFEDWEAMSYLRDLVDGDDELLRKLINRLEDRGVDFHHYKKWM